MFMCVCGGGGGVTSDSKLGGVGEGENTFFSVSLHGFQNSGGTEAAKSFPLCGCLS